MTRDELARLRELRRQAWWSGIGNRRKAGVRRRDRQRKAGDRNPPDPLEPVRETFERFTIL